MRCLVVKNNIVVNIAEFHEPIPDTYQDCVLVAEPVPNLNVGDDATDALKTHQVNRSDILMFRELFRLTNAVRALQIPSQPALTQVQYKSFLKSLL